MTEPRNGKEGRFARHLRVAREVHAEPRRIVPLTRGWLADFWTSRGGGFYGLGYVLTFIALEIRSLGGSVGGLAGTDSVTTFVLGQAVQYVLRFSVESILNAFLALIWPIYLLQWLGGWGIAVLAVGYAAFALVVRPSIAGWLPELQEARARRQRLDEEKRERKRLKRARK